MKRAVVLQGVRMIRFREIFERYDAGCLTQMDAAELLGIGERTFRRWCVRFEDEGESGLLDRRLGKPSPKRVPERVVSGVERLYRQRYAGFTAKHFHEHLVKNHGYRLSYTYTKRLLQQRGLLAAAPHRGAHRRKRPRRPMAGMLLHQDGSRHQWIAGFERELDLIVTLDDATSEIYSAFLVEEEGTLSSFRGFAEVFAAKGLFCSLYSDRGSHYFLTPKAGAGVDKKALTQVGRALAQLGIEHIPAYSPEARGRSERAFRTLQDRLPKELALAGITDVAAANTFIATVYLPEHNARFAVAPAQAGTAFVSARPEQWRDVLCIHHERVVGNDNTIVIGRLRLQIPPSPLRPHFVKSTVRVLQYVDGTYAIFHGPMCLGHYAPDGQLIGAQKWAA